MVPVPRPLLICQAVFSFSFLSPLPHICFVTPPLSPNRLVAGLRRDMASSGGQTARVSGSQTSETPGLTPALMDSPRHRGNAYKSNADMLAIDMKQREYDSGQRKTVVFSGSGSGDPQDVVEIEVSRKY